MKRLLVVAVVAALAVAALGPAQAAEVQEPIDMLCKGTGGWGGTFWKAHSSNTPAGVLDIRHCLMVAPGSSKPLASPDVDPTHPEPWWPLIDWAADTNPVFPGNRFKFEATGDFACGSGTLARANTNNFISYSHGIARLTTWGLDWSATFENGVGELSGTAWKGVRPPWDDAPEETREISGYMIIEDGAAAGQCDDSEGASDVFLHLRLT